jgi:hypothetical protein
VGSAALVGSIQAVGVTGGRGLCLIVCVFLVVLVQLPDAVFNNPRPLAALEQVYAQRPEAIWQVRPPSHRTTTPHKLMFRGDTRYTSRRSCVRDVELISVAGEHADHRGSGPP